MKFFVNDRYSFNVETIRGQVKQAITKYKTPRSIQGMSLTLLAHDVLACPCPLNSNAVRLSYFAGDSSVTKSCRVPMEASRSG